jgi:hypothetical protein
MKDSEILEIINSYEHKFKNYGDGGRSEIKELALALNRVNNDNELKTIIDFFLREINSNRFGLRSLCLQTFVFAKKTSIAPELEKIYLSRQEEMSDYWKESLISAMMDLHYTKPLDLYQSFINWHLVNHTGRAFYLIVKYCLIDKNEGIRLLSGYYLVYLTSTDCFEYSNDQHIGHLISKFSEGNRHLLIELLNATFSKDKKVGLLLKSILTNYIDLHLSNNVKNVLLDEINKTIKI